MPMAICVSPDSYPEILEVLKRDLPKSFMAYYSLRNLMNGLTKDKMVWVNKWPQFTSMVISEEKLEKSSPRRTTIYCTNAKYAKSLDDILKHISRRSLEPLFLIGGTEDVIDAIKEVCMTASESSSNTNTLIEENPTKVYSVCKEDLIKVSVPSGITVSSLTSSEAEIVRDTWAHGSELSDAKEWITSQINTLCTTCLFNEDNKPIAWGLQYDVGCIGMVYVIPEYRKRGLGSLVISRLAEKILKTEDFVYSCIELDNDASFAMHEKIGYRMNPKFPKCLFTLYHYEV